MKNEHVIDQLSAYLDGEAADPARIEAHLQDCLTCRKRYDELTRLSQYMRELAEPDVSPSFAARVVLRAKESNARPAALWPRFMWSGAVAAALLLVTAAWFSVRTGTEAPDAPGVIDAGSPLSELQRRIADGDEAAIHELSGWVDEEDFTSSTEDYPTVLAEVSAWDELRHNLFWSERLEFYPTDLSSTEDEALRELLLTEFNQQE